MHSKFNVRAPFLWKMDRIYRVYATDQELFLIRIGGQTVDWVAGLNQLGLLGVWLGRKLNARRERALEERSSHADQLAPEAQLSLHKHNCRVSLAEIASSTFEPGKTIGLHGAYVACWRLVLRGGNSWRFLFEEASHAQTALQVLSTLLRERFVSQAVWVPGAERFSKPEPGLVGQTQP